ncbi:MAG: tandem-95 repeat protein, partial [Acidobacteria bacterium]|nr:tandem-95 repeat protein [Acidobacteriota bacterium]
MEVYGHCPTASNGQTVDTTIDFRQDDHVDDPSLGPTNLRELDENTTVAGVISELGDLDYFEFEVRRNGPVTIKVDVNEYFNNLNTQLRVSDADTGAPLGAASPNGAYDAEVMLDLLRNTRYLVEVSSNGDIGELGAYNLRIIFPDPPRARNDQATTNEGQTATINILANDDPGDAPIDPTSVVLVGPQPLSGTVTFDAAGVATYTPTDLNFFGTVSFRYNVSNTFGSSNNATVTIEVINLPDPPVAVDDLGAVVNEGESINIVVLANDFDPDDPLNVIDPTTVVITSQGTGTATANPDGTITYVPAAGFTGTDSFTYQVSDTDTPSLTSSSATVDVRVNARPMAFDDAPITDEDVPVVIDVLANDVDPDPPPFGGLDNSTVTIISLPTNGVITSINVVTGAVTYEPNPEFNGSDSFTYTVDDRDGATSNIASVDITISFVNDAPVAVDDFAGNDELDEPFDIPVLDNDFDIDPETELRLDSIEILTPPNSGTATPNPDGTITYTPNPGFAGGDSFTYRVFDNGSTIPGEVDLPSNEATVSVRVGRPITISGYVYVDFNNDQVRQPDELPVGNVLVRVAKVNGPFTFSKPLLTDANGFYMLEETPGVDVVPAGVYEITEIQPDILIDGLESLGTGNANPPGNPVDVGNDIFSNVIMGSGGNATEFNFGELGLRANFVLDLSGRVFLASSGPGGIAMPGGVLSSLDLTAGEVLVSLPEGWDGVLTASAVLS